MGKANDLSDTVDSLNMQQQLQPAVGVVAATQHAL